MNRFIQTIPLNSRVNFFETPIEGYQIKIFKWFDLTLSRWEMNIENLTLNQSLYGVVMNQGVDLLVAAGHLDLQAMVLVNLTPQIGLEASSTNLGTELILFYMDLETYDEIVLQGALFSREVYRVPAIGH